MEGILESYFYAVDSFNRQFQRECKPVTYLPFDCAECGRVNVNGELEGVAQCEHCGILICESCALADAHECDVASTCASDGCALCVEKDT